MDRVNDLEYHPLANRFPLLEGEPFEAFVAFMGQNGYNSATKKVWLYEGKILDGRNTYRALLRLNIAPEFQQWDGQYGDPWNFVKMMNLHRCHYTPSQWAMAAAMEHETSKTSRVPGRHPAGAVAESYGVSETSLHRAKRVMKKGTPAVKKLVVDGKVSVEDADKVIQEPQDVQDAAAAKVEAGESATLYEASRGDAAEPEPGTPKPKPVDNEGHIIPPHLRDVFGSSLFHDYSDRLHELKRCSKALLATSPWWLHDQETTLQLDRIIDRLQNAQPYALCVECKGAKAGCDGCRHQGWVPRWRYDEMMFGKT